MGFFDSIVKPVQSLTFPGNIPGQIDLVSQWLGGGGFQAAGGGGANPRAEFDRLAAIYNQASPGSAPAWDPAKSAADNIKGIKDSYQQAIYSGQINPGATAYQMQGSPVDASGRPVAPQWLSLLDPTTGLMRDQYQIKGAIDTRGMEGLRSEALRTGPSTWRTLMEQSEADKLAKRQGSALAQAKGQLASTRGLSTGAAERMAKASNLGGLQERQNLARSMAIADEEKRMNALQNLPGQELGLAQFQRGTEQANVGSALNEINAKRQQEQDQYLKQMEAWAAQKVAASAPKSGKK